jgi:hypothetical protein
MPRMFYPGKRASGAHLVGGWVGPRAGLDALNVREFGPATHSYTMRVMALIGFVISVCRSARPPAWNNWPDFHEIWYLSIFRKSDEKIKVSLTTYMNNIYFIQRTIYFLSCQAVPLRMRNVSDKTCRVTQNTCFMFNSVFSPRKTWRL